MILLFLYFCICLNVMYYLLAKTNMTLVNILCDIWKCQIVCQFEKNSKFDCNELRWSNCMNV